MKKRTVVSSWVYLVLYIGGLVVEIADIFTVSTTYRSPFLHYSIRIGGPAAMVALYWSLLRRRRWAWFGLIAMYTALSCASVILSIHLDSVMVLMIAVPLAFLITDPPKRWAKRNTSTEIDDHAHGDQERASQWNR
ncbi:MAG: hypothetical protein Q7T82_14200 [Armatimonadota bacterium]|nr:hypothetical protein [Armatimonadota bacterium]